MESVEPCRLATTSEERRATIMKSNNAREYSESLRRLKPVIYYKGSRIGDVTRHPATSPRVRAAALTYALANQEEYADLAIASSHLTGHTISRFNHVHQTLRTLSKRQKCYDCSARRQVLVFNVAWV